MLQKVLCENFPELAQSLICSSFSLLTKHVLHALMFPGLSVWREILCAKASEAFYGYWAIRPGTGQVLCTGPEGLRPSSPPTRARHPCPDSAVKLGSLPSSWAVEARPVGLQKTWLWNWSTISTEDTCHSASTSPLDLALYVKKKKKKRFNRSF